MATYKITQLPSNMDKGLFEWILQDEECNITLKNGKLSGEWVEWNDAGQDWTSRPMSADEITKVVIASRIIIPTKPVVSVASLLMDGKVKLAAGV